MTSKERVLAAFLRGGAPPDRVPIHSTCAARCSRPWARPTAFRFTTRIWYEDLTYRISGNELRVAMGSDCVGGHRSAARLCASHRRRRQFHQRIRNEAAAGTALGGVDQEKSPMRHVNTITEVEDFQFPHPLADGRYRRCRALRCEVRGRSILSSATSRSRSSP